MPLRLIIASQHEDLQAAWSGVFAGLDSVALTREDIHHLLRDPAVDAVLMLGMFAHERYGGVPRVGESQVLSTRGEPGMRPWVVTMPAFAGHLERRAQADEAATHVLVPDGILLPEQETFICFTRVFQCIEAFNADAAEPKIRTLAFELEFLNMPSGDARREAEAVRRAYVEQYGEVPA